METTTLLLPDENDSDEELKRLADFLVTKAGPTSPGISADFIRNINIPIHSQPRQNLSKGHTTSANKQVCTMSISATSPAQNRKIHIVTNAAIRLSSASAIMSPRTKLRIQLVPIAVPKSPGDGNKK